MVDIFAVGDRLDGYIIVDLLALGGLDRYGPLTGFGAKQDDLARLLVMHHQRVRIGNYFYGRSFSGGDVVDYVTLSCVQGERHFRSGAIGCVQQSRTKQHHTDSGDEPRKQSTSSFCIHLLHLAFFAAYGMSIVFGVGT